MHLKNLFFTLIFCLTVHGAHAQEMCNCPQQVKTGKGTFYLTWGYNLDWFSKSDLHFRGNDFGGYDFTLYDVKARDRASLDKIGNSPISVPQYVYRLGYYFNNKHNTGIEINFDHAKYIMVRDQTVRLKGRIGEQNYDKDTLVGKDFLLFEHTNGANFLLVNFLKRHTLLTSTNKKHWVSFVGKVGAGMVIPKTDVTLFGTRLDNKFHLAGYVMGLDAGLRYDAFKYFFIEASVKGVFANYTNVLTVGDGKAHHYFFAAETIFSAGLQMAL